MIEDPVTGHSAQARANGIIERIAAGIIALDHELRYTYINHQAERLIGGKRENLKRESLIGKPVSEAPPLTGSPQFETACRRAMAEQTGLEFQEFCPALDTWLEFHLYPDPEGVTVYFREVTESKRVERMLDERLRFETLLGELSAAFAILPPSLVDQEINKWIKRLVEFLDIDWGSFIQSAEGGTLYRTHSYSTAGVDLLQTMQINDQFPWAAVQLGLGKIVNWPRIPDDLPQEADKERAFCLDEGTKSHLSIPVSIGGEIICALAFSSLRYFRDWPEEMVARLRLVAEVFANAIARKHGEEALRESENLWRTTFENAAIGIGLVDAGGHPVQSNPALHRMLGYTSEEIRRMSFVDFTHADDIAKDMALFKELIKGKRDFYHIEKRYIRKDGQVRSANLTVSGVRDERGKWRFGVGMIEDITERKRTEEALRESEERFRQLAEHIREVFYMTPVTLEEMLYVSPAYESVWGRTQESVYKEPASFLDAVHPDDLPRIENDIIKHRDRGFEFEYRIIRPDGSVRWIWDRGFPIRDESGQVYRIAGIAEDITERKQTEEQFRATSEQLRALMVSLRKAREEEGIRIAREIHDELGAALTSLRWDLESIDKTLQESGEQARARQLGEKIRGMLALIDSTVNVVRRISSELRPSILDDLGLGAAIEWQAQQFQARTGITCRCDCSIEAAHLDNEKSTAIFRIFQEALTNVLRHSRATIMDITLEEDGSEFVLTMNDNGRGITESQKSGVLALGLLGMRERAHLIGGKIEITGVEGRGTRIILRVPIASVQAE
jgi:PAS domain S-box-containing protein